MADVLVWWLVAEILGLAALPAAWRVFASLPDRGYAFAKPLAVFVVAYVVWIAGITGLATNSRETILFVLFVTAALSWLWAWRQEPTPADTAQPQPSHRPSAPGSAAAQEPRKNSGPPPIIAWLRANVRLIAIEEAIFAAGIIVWAIFKAYNPEIIATEKPMELAFLNGILRSEQFPPLDPWLSGFSISYYYFGYLMAAILTRLSGVSAAVAFNLVQVLGFALTLTGSFSIVYNLVAHRSGRQSPVVRAAVASGLLAGFFVVILGNLEGFLEFFYAQGVGSPAFWKSLGIADLTQPYVSGTWYPSSNWWWWKASRVVGTAGTIGDYTINEFPFFSFMLGDNHPHVLALPYVLMAVALALGILLAPHQDLLAAAAERNWSRLLGTWFFPALLLGGLFFLNSWDFPTYMLIAILAYAVRSVRWRGRLDAAVVKEILLFSLPMAVLGVLLYLPFYLSFQSQASGFGIVRVRSQLHHFLLIFGVFLFIALGYLAVKLAEWRSKPPDERGPAGRLLPVFVVVGLVAAVLMIVLQVWTTVSTLLFSSLAGVLVSLLLLFFLGLALFVLLTAMRDETSDIFVILLIGVGCLVTLIPEWVYINDNFGGNLSRMNTVFKFFYQGWILLALAAAYGVYYVAAVRPSGARITFSVPRVAFLVVTLLLVLAGTFYPAMAFYSKANGFQGTPTLDGTAYMKTSAPEDYRAIQWANANIEGAPVAAEAIGGEYSEYGRLSTHTGIPAVLGWPGHEIQWRGTVNGWESRESDINRLYATTDANEAKSIIKKYGIMYVLVGRLERQTTGSDGKSKYSQQALDKFASFMDTAYSDGSTAIYRVRQ